MSANEAHTPPQEVIEQTSTVRPVWYKRPPIIASIALVVIAVLVAVGLALKTHTDTLRAREEYQAAQTNYQQTLSELDHAQTQSQALIDLVVQRATGTDTTALAVAVEEAAALSSVQAQDVSTLGREQAKQATSTVKAAQGQARSVLDRLTASFDGVREEVADAATTSFDQGVKTLNEAIETAGTANRGGVDQALADQLDTALKEAQTIDQTKPENLETIAGIESVFTRADQANTAAKTLSDATTAVNDAATAYTQAQQAQTTSGYEPAYATNSYNSGGGGYNSSNAGSNGGGDVCGGGPYCYNPNFPEWIQATEDGSWHHQVQPDENGTVTDNGTDGGCIAGCD